MTFTSPTLPDALYDQIAGLFNTETALDYQGDESPVSSNITDAQRKFENMLRNSILDGDGGFYAPRWFSRNSSHDPQRSIGDIDAHMKQVMEKLGIS